MARAVAYRRDMRKLIALGLVVSGVAMASDRAVWTGSIEYISTRTGQNAVRCEYQYGGETFWKTFRGGTCPRVVEAE